MKKPLDRRSFGAVVAATAVFAATPLRHVRAQGATIKIGRLTPTSGFEAGIGQHMAQAIKVGTPILKDMGYRFEVVEADTESKPEVARTQAEKLIREGCHMLVGAFDWRRPSPLRKSPSRTASRTSSTSAPTRRSPSRASSTCSAISRPR